MGATLLAVGVDRWTLRQGDPRRDEGDRAGERRADPRPCGGCLELAGTTQCVGVAAIPGVARAVPISPRAPAPTAAQSSSL